MFFAADDVDDSIGDGLFGLMNRIFKDILHYFRKNLVIAILQLHPVVIDLIGEGNQFVDDPHYILGVVSIISVLYVKVVDQEKVELVAFPVVNYRHFWFYPFADSFASGLRVFSGDVVEYLVALPVYEFHQVKFQV